MEPELDHLEAYRAKLYEHPDACPALLVPAGDQCYPELTQLGGEGRVKGRITPNQHETD